MFAVEGVASARPYTVCASFSVPWEQPLYGRHPGSPYSGAFISKLSVDFLKQVGPPHLEALSRDSITLPTTAGPLAPTSLLAQTAHTCFDEHIGISLAPEVLWYAILSQFAADVKQNPEAYRDLFTESGSQKTIIVRHDGLRLGSPDGWDAAISMFDPELRGRIPSGVMGECLPSFSSSTEESNIATLVCFMDAASPFYRYEVHTRCGIPSIRLEGTASDWSTLVASAKKLAALRKTTHMARYFVSLLPVLEKIAATARGERDIDFWRSIYKANSESGGVTVTGWLTAFWAYVSDRKGSIVPKQPEDFDWRNLRDSWGSFRPDTFTSHVSSVPFVWDYFGQRLDMRFMAGVLGVDEVDRHLAPRLGWAVAHAK